MNDPRTNTPSPKSDEKRPIKALALFFAVAFFAEHEFELDHLSEKLKQHHLWRSSELPNTNAEDVMIVSNGSCVPNLRSAFFQADKSYPGLFENKQGVYKIHNERVQDCFTRYNLPNINDWRQSHHVTISQPILSSGNQISFPDFMFSTETKTSEAKKKNAIAPVHRQVTGQIKEQLLKLKPFSHQRKGKLSQPLFQTVVRILNIKPTHQLPVYECFDCDVTQKVIFTYSQNTGMGPAAPLKQILEKHCEQVLKHKETTLLYKKAMSTAKEQLNRAIQSAHQLIDESGSPTYDMRAKLIHTFDSIASFRQAFHDVQLNYNNATASLQQSVTSFQGRLQNVLQLPTKVSLIAPSATSSQK